MSTTILASTSTSSHAPTAFYGPKWRTSRISWSTLLNKAIDLKKIRTHRDPAEDPTVRHKEKEIREYQVSVNMCKKYIKKLNVKIESMADQTKLDGSANKIK